LASVHRVEADVEGESDVDRRDAPVVDREVRGTGDAAGHAGDVAHQIVEDQGVRAAVRGAVPTEIEPGEDHVSAQESVATLLDDVGRQDGEGSPGDVGSPPVPTFPLTGLVVAEEVGEVGDAPGDLDDKVGRQYRAGYSVLQ